MAAPADVPRALLRQAAARWRVVTSSRAATNQPGTQIDHERERRRQADEDHPVKGVAAGRRQPENPADEHRHCHYCGYDGRANGAAPQSDLIGHGHGLRSEPRSAPLAIVSITYPPRPLKQRSTKPPNDIQLPGPRAPASMTAPPKTRPIAPERASAANIVRSASAALVSGPNTKSLCAASSCRRGRLVSIGSTRARYPAPPAPLDGGARPLSATGSRAVWLPARKRKSREMAGCSARGGGFKVRDEAQPVRRAEVAHPARGVQSKRLVSGRFEHRMHAAQRCEPREALV